MKPCKPDEIRNPATNRCVKKNGKIGKTLVVRSRSQSRSRASPRVSSRRASPRVSPRRARKPCKSNEIRNPATGRCVKKTGEIGRKLVRPSGASPRVAPPASPRRSAKCKSDEIMNPATKRCVKKNGKIGKALLKPASKKKSPIKKKSKSPKKASPKNVGFDVIMMEERPVAEFLKEDKSNVLIQVGNANYLSNKSYFRNQGLFAECKRVARTDPVDISNALDLSKDFLFQMNSVGIPAGYVSVKDINEMIKGSHQRYSVKPTSRKTISIASKSVVDILKQPVHLRPPGYLISAVHCGPDDKHVIHKLVKI